MFFNMLAPIPFQIQKKNMLFFWGWCVSNHPTMRIFLRKYREMPNPWLPWVVPSVSCFAEAQNSSSSSRQLSIAGFRWFRWPGHQNLPPWEPKTFIFRASTPYIGGLKPSFFMVLGSKGMGFIVDLLNYPLNWWHFFGGGGVGDSQKHLLYKHLVYNYTLPETKKSTSDHIFFGGQAFQDELWISPRIYLLLRSTALPSYRRCAKVRILRKSWPFLRFGPPDAQQTKPTDAMNVHPGELTAGT